MNKILLVDGNPLMWRAAYSAEMKDVAAKIANSLFDALRVVEPSDVICCWDAGKSRWRSEVFPSYKAHRLQQKRDSGIDMESLMEQKTTAQRYLTGLGIRQVMVRGVEADDILAWLSEYFNLCFGWRSVLMTGDRDFWQLVKPGVEVYDYKTKMFIDAVAVKAHFGIIPSRVAELKAIAGDASDNIPGVKGIGDKTASKLLEEWGSLGKILHLNAVKELKKKKITARILDVGDMVGEMFRLTKIPSLVEAPFCLTADESASLRDQLGSPVERNDLDARVMSTCMGLSLMPEFRVLPPASVNISGILDYLKVPEVQSPLSTLDEFDSVVHTCRRCPLYRESRSQGRSVTYPQGHAGCDILIVGRNPTECDWQEADVFSAKDPVGVLVDEFLSEIGVKRSECWMTNACKCHSENDRPPTYGELHACSYLLRAELDILKPGLVIAFGCEAMSLVSPYSTRVSKHSGEILDKPIGWAGKVDSKVVISVHPSAALRSERGRLDFEIATEAVRKLIKEVTQ